MKRNLERARRMGKTKEYKEKVRKEKEKLNRELREKQEKKIKHLEKKSKDCSKHKLCKRHHNKLTVPPTGIGGNPLPEEPNWDERDRTDDTKVPLVSEDDTQDVAHQISLSVCSPLKTNNIKNQRFNGKLDKDTLEEVWKE